MRASASTIRVRASPRAGARSPSIASSSRTASSMTIVERGRWPARARARSPAARSRARYAWRAPACAARFLDLVRLASAVSTRRPHAATRRTGRACQPRRIRSAPAAGAAPSRSSARSTDRCRETRPSAERRSSPSRTPARTPGRRCERGGLRSCGTGTSRLRGSSRTGPSTSALRAWHCAPTPAGALAA